MLSINLEGLENYTRPAMLNTMKYLRRAQEIFYSMTIPNDFLYALTLRSMPNKISDINAKVDKSEKWVEEAIKNFSNAENSNNSVFDNAVNVLERFMINIEKGSSFNKNLLKKESTNENLIVDFWNFISDWGDSTSEALGDWAIDMSEMIGETASSIGDGFISFLSDSWNTAAKMAEDFGSFLINDVPSAMNDLGGLLSDKWNYLCENTILGDVVDFGECIIASSANSLLGAFKGLCELEESLADVAVILGAAVSTQYTLQMDSFSNIGYLISRLTGNTNEYESITASMWSQVMGFVAEDHVNNAFKEFYENNIIGQWLDEHAHEWFKSNGIVFNVMSGIGYTTGIVALSFIVAPILGVAAGTGLFSTIGIPSLLAGLAGMGGGTEYAWGQMRDSSMVGIEEMYINGDISEEQYNSIIAIRSFTDEEWAEIEQDYRNGNIEQEQYELMRQIREMPDDWRSIQNFFSGIGYGAAVGVWEGVQWYIGGRLTKYAILGRPIPSAVANIAIDSLFNAADTPYRAVVESIALGEDFEEAFKNQGGTDAMLTNFLIGLGLSTGGEIFNAYNANGQQNNLLERLNNIEAFNGLDAVTANRIREIIEENNNVNFDRMTDAEFNLYVTELISTRNSQIEEVAKYLYGDQAGNISQEVRLKIENGIDAINRSGLLEGIEENKATVLRNRIMEEYFKENIDLNNISAEELQRRIKNYEEMYERIEASKESFRDLIDRGYIKEEDFKEIIENHIFIKGKEEFEALWRLNGGNTDPSSVLAFYYQGNLYLRELNDVTTITHEINHALGRLSFTSYTGEVVFHRGINEAFTEKIAIDLTEGENIRGYMFNVNMLNNLIEIIEKEGYNENVILDAYFGGLEDANHFKEIVDEISGREGTFERIAELMDITDGVGYSVEEVKVAREELISIIVELEKKVGLL